MKNTQNTQNNHDENDEREIAMRMPTEEDITWIFASSRTSLHAKENVPDHILIWFTDIENFTQECMAQSMKQAIMSDFSQLQSKLRVVMLSEKGML